MDKLKMMSKDKTQENFEILQRLFPNAVTETITGYDEDGKAIVERAIDKDVLQQEINAAVVEGKDERYQFTWPDKKRAIISANAPINKTLRPCREESVDFDNTENLYIEGDNLEVLKLLQETYLGKIKMIYIDPPYNTGHDFVYNDKFSVSADEWDEMSGELDEYGNRLTQNTESNGRFHTDWLNMIYPRLKIARDLLTDDGVIFISIDENEIENAKLVCDEVFGKKNSIGSFIWRKKDGGGQAKDYFVIEHEYIIVYKKSDRLEWTDKFEKRSISEYNKTDINGKYKITKLAKWGNTARREDRPSMYYPLCAPDNSDCFPIAPDGGEGRWRIGKEKMNELISQNLIHWEKKNNLWIPYEKEYYSGQTKIIKERSILYSTANTGDGSNQLTAIFGKKDFFENPKPIELIQVFLQGILNTDDIILDFFSGSGTTAHAVINLNLQDIYNGVKGRRKFIMVQLPEKTNEKSAAFKAGYINICEIGKERIRRAGKNEKRSLWATMGSSLRWNDRRKAELGENYVCPDDVDIGFRVLKLDSSNMKDVYYNPADFQKSLLDTTIDNIKEDRTPEDLLFQVMLDLGVLLSEKIEESEIAGKKVYNVANGYLIACFDSDVNEEVITAVAKQKPIYFVMRDSSLSTDSTATNFDQIFETYSPDTVRKVI